VAQVMASINKKVPNVISTHNIQCIKSQVLSIRFGAARPVYFMKVRSSRKNMN
jgi:hypothetical protein